MKSRRKIEFSERFNRRWLGYAAAAGAAGVGMVTAAQPARADIIYTPANLSFGPGSPVSFDIGHAGVNNFTLAGQTFIGFPITTRTLAIWGNSKGAAVLFGPTDFVRLLPGGTYIGPKFSVPSDRWGSGGGQMGLRRTSTFKTTYGTAHSSSVRGDWPPFGEGGFVGLRFLIDGQEHYGWAQVSIADSPLGTGYSGTLVGYAYDTVPNQGLDAGQTASTPEPATLGLLALGSLGVGFWRRKAVGSPQ